MTSKQKTIAFWIVTVLAALPMLGSGAAVVAGVDEVLGNYARLGYPAYFATLIGTWKLLGAVALVVRKFPAITQAAYAGFFFTMTGASISHLAAGDPIGQAIPPLVVLTLMGASYFLSPERQGESETGFVGGAQPASA